MSADPKEIQYINEQLRETYGIDSDTGRPIFRVVFSDDQLEKRLVSTTDLGIQLLHPEVREVKKYPYMKHFYVLERLVIVPVPQQIELAGLQLSYEPLWCFCDAQHNPVQPVWKAAKFVVDTLYAALGKSSLAKYKDDEKNTTKEGRQERIKELENELFGDESGLQGKTHLTGEGIVVPSTYESTQEMK